MKFWETLTTFFATLLQTHCGLPVQVYNERKGTIVEDIKAEDVYNLQRNRKQNDTPRISVCKYQFV